VPLEAPGLIPTGATTLHHAYGEVTALIEAIWNDISVSLGLLCSATAVAFLLFAGIFLLGATSFFLGWLLLLASGLIFATMTVVMDCKWVEIKRLRWRWLGRAIRDVVQQSESITQSNLRSLYFRSATIHDYREAREYLHYCGFGLYGYPGCRIKREHQVQAFAKAFERSAKGYPYRARFRVCRAHGVTINALTVFELRRQDGSVVTISPQKL
jgi:hypothetical protein